MNTASDYKPERRYDESVVVQAVDEELVIYDLITHNVHALNPIAREVWNWCDGTRPLNELTQLLVDHLGLSEQQAQELTHLTLAEFETADLLVENGLDAILDHKPARRKVLSLIGIASLLPVIYTITAPQPAAAQSPGDAPDCQPNPGGAGTCFDGCNCSGNVIGNMGNCLDCDNMASGLSWERASDGACFNINVPCL